MITPSWALFWTLASFIAGIAIASLSDSFIVQSMVGILAVFALGRYYLRSELMRLLVFLAVIGCAFGLAIVRQQLTVPDPTSTAFLPETQVTFSGTVTDMRENESGQIIQVRDIRYGDEFRTDGIQVNIPAFPKIRSGIEVQISCALENPEPFDGFAYDQYLASRGIYKTCFTNDVPIVISQPRSISAAFWQVRQDLIESINHKYDEPHGTLLAGLLLGERGFRDEWNNLFVETGTSHIVAASGYNITIISFVLFSLLTWIGIRRQVAFPVLLLGIIAYVLLIGAEAPIIRAGIMGALVLTARFMGRKTSMRNIVAITIAIMLALNPLILFHDVGFQLSALSTIGLIALAPFIEERLQFIPSAFSIRESLTSTIAATFATLPIILLSFGRISLIGPIVNLLILPLIPYAMLSGTLSIGSPVIQEVFVGITWFLLEVILFIIQSLAELPFSTLAVGPWGIASVLGVYCLIIVLCFILQRKAFQPSR